MCGERLTGTTENVERQVPGPLAPGFFSRPSKEVSGLATEETTASVNRLSRKMTLEVCASLCCFVAIVHGETAIRVAGRVLESGQPRVWISSAQWLLSFDRFLSSCCECFEHAHWSSHNCGNPRDSLLWKSFRRFATPLNPEFLCGLPSLLSRKTRHFCNPAPSWYVRNSRFSKGVYLPDGHSLETKRALPCLVRLSCRSDLSKCACPTPRLPDILTRTIIPNGVSGYSDQAV